MTSSSSRPIPNADLLLFTFASGVIFVLASLSRHPISLLYSGPYMTIFFYQMIMLGTNKPRTKWVLALMRATVCFLVATVIVCTITIAWG